VLDAIPAPIWFKTADGIYRGCNLAFERYLGHPRQEIIGHGVDDVAPPDLAEVYRRADVALFEAGGTQVYETEVEWADGSRRQVVFQKSVYRDGSGRVAGLAGVMVDVTAQRRAEGELRARLAQQEAVARLARLALGEVTAEALAEEAVRLSAEALQVDTAVLLEVAERDGGRVLLPAGGAVGIFGSEAIPVDPAGPAAALLSGAGPLIVPDVEVEAPVQVPAAFRRAGYRSGAGVRVGAPERPVGILCGLDHAPHAFGADDVRFLEAVGDVLGVGLSRRRALDAARQAQARLALADRLASIGTLAAGVAHELSNPLSFVLANVEFAAGQLAGAAQDAGRRQEVARALADARLGGERMRGIVRDLKTASRAGHATAPVGLRSVLEYAVGIASAEIRRRARIAWELAEVPPVQGDEARLGQVFLNLLVNAAQAFRHDAPDRNTIRLSLQRWPDGRVAAEIADNGPGIPAEIRSRIFEPFFTTKPPGVGTGLGLWICNDIVASHGGEIHVESAPDAGARFVVLLPVSGGPDAEGSTG